MGCIAPRRSGVWFSSAQTHCVASRGSLNTFCFALLRASRFTPVMSERARLLGGSLSIESSPGAGTVVETVVPVRPAESARRGAR